MGFFTPKVVKFITEFELQDSAGGGLGSASGNGLLSFLFILGNFKQVLLPLETNVDHE